MSARRQRCRSGRKPDAAGDEQDVAAAQRFCGEAVAVRPAQPDLVADAQLVQRVRQLADVLDGGLDIVVAEGGDGKHRLAHAGNGEHAELTRQGQEGAFPLRRLDAEGLDVRRLLRDLRHDAKTREQRVKFLAGAGMVDRDHRVTSAARLINSVMSRCPGHFSMHLPQPAQSVIP